MIPWTGFTVATAPSVEPVSTAEAKDHLDIKGSDRDTYIDTLVGAARQALEKQMNRAFISQTLDVAYDAFPRSDRSIILPRGPLQSVTTVMYFDEDGSTSTVFSSGSYQVDIIGFLPRILIDPDADWPTDALRSGNGVVVRIVTGYGDAASDVPDNIVHAIKLGVRDLYDNPSETITGTIVSHTKAIQWLSSVDRAYTFA